VVCSSSTTDPAKLAPRTPDLQHQVAALAETGRVVGFQVVDVVTTAASSSEKLAEHGVLGLVCLFLISAVVWLYRARDADAKNYNAELQKATDGRLADAKAYTDKVLTIQSTVLEAVKALQELYEMEQNRNQPRQRGRFPSSGGT